MRLLERADLLSLEDYAEQRADWRARVMAHKQSRVVHLGEHARLCFEDRLTMQYQIQEMLRAERIFDAAGIREELEVYNALIPTGTNLKATFMLEYEDVAQRRAELARLAGIEHALRLQAADRAPVSAIANEDLERSTDEKTAAVHFVRFELPPEDIAALKAGAPLAFGIDHPNCRIAMRPAPDAARQSLVADLD